MQAKKIEVNNNLQEVARHGSYDFPLAIYTDKFNLFEEGYIKWHWHKELQFSYSLYDKVIIFIEDERIILSPGQGIMINSNVLHQIKPYNNGNCRMFSIDFDPVLIGEKDSIIKKKYLNPVIENTNLKFILLKPDIMWQKNILKNLKKVFNISHKKTYGYELEMKNYLSIAWLNLIKEIKEDITNSTFIISNDDKRVKSAIQYIHAHYTDNIELDNIATAANISKSECCRSFKRILKITPFEYLMEYRVSKAAELLLKSKETISNIAINTGFNGISYFGKVFRKYMNYSPSEYRSKYANLS